MSKYSSTGFGMIGCGGFVALIFVIVAWQVSNARQATELSSEFGESKEGNFVIVDPSKDVFLQQVNPGVSREGEVIYTGDPDASDFTLSVGDKNIFGGEDAALDLGF